VFYFFIFFLYSLLFTFVFTNFYFLVHPSVGWKKSLLEISPPLPLIVILVMYVVSFMSAIKSLYKIRDPPRHRMYAMLILNILQNAFICYMYRYNINLTLESLYLLKKTHQNSFGSFKDLSIHIDRQRLCFIPCYYYDIGVSWV
jgi:hypothetical protein